MTKSDTNSSMPVPAAGSEDEIDLGQLAAALKRHWRLIAKVAGGTLLLSAVISFTQKPVWEGEFQIVLAQKQKGGGVLASLAAANPGLASLAGFSGGGGEDSLETEVQILESPSVLKPVFDFVRLSKQRAGENVDQMRYASWSKRNLDVKLEKGTSVLNISYRDSDKSLILPVIQRISKAYQDYSGRDRRRDITNGIVYLRQQISELGPKAEASMRRAQAFALFHGLGLQDGMPASSGAATGSGAAQLGGGSVEASRQAAQAKVIGLKQLLANARLAGDNVLFQAPQLKANEELFKNYQTVQAELAEKRSRLRDNDQLIRSLQRQRSALVSTLNRQTIGLLQGELATAQADLQSSSRPKEVELEHRQLVRQALRDEKTLVELENQLQISALEKAKNTDPWDLISTPTLLDRPVSPKKARNMALGLLVGLVLGSGAALVVDRRGGKVWSIDELRTALPYPLLAQFDPADPASWQAPLGLLADGSLRGCSKVALIPVLDELQPALQQGLQAALQRSDPAAQVIATNDLMLARSCQAQLLVVSPGMATREQLLQLRQNLELQGQPVAGLLVIEGA